MNAIDLTTPEKALAYLKSLPPDSVIEIQDGRSALTSAETDAVSAALGQTAYNWANDRLRWEWTAGDLVAAIEADTTPHDPGD